MDTGIKTYHLEVQVHLYQGGDTGNCILQVLLTGLRGSVPKNLLYKHVTHVVKALCGDHNATNCHRLCKRCQHLHQCRVIPKKQKQDTQRVNWSRQGSRTIGTITCTYRAVKYAGQIVSAKICTKNDEKRKIWHRTLL